MSKPALETLLKKCLCSLQLVRVKYKDIFKNVVAFFSSFQSKRVNVLASDSSSSIQEERKRVKKSVPKQMKQKRIKSPEHKSAEILPTLTDPAEESTKELMICVEDATQISVFEDKSKEPEELMEVECLDEEKGSYNRQVSVLLC